ncbi:MAG TPA: flagellar hook-basal body protein [Candidatus Kapabacteria bacterium]|nr:flagellar hook-basal body protein [Candidatus Kapabacteria bacterium]
MLKELYIAGLGMQNQQTRLEVVANNIANAASTGFKRASVFERNMQDARANFYNVKGDVEQNDPPIGSYYDFSNGAFEKTDNPLDMSIDGKGFFFLKDDEGKEFLSRAGNFQLNEDGTIVAKDGKYLMGVDGIINVSKEILSNHQTTNDNKENGIRINDQGEVFVNDFSVGKVKIVDIQDYKTLQRISNQEFIATWESELQDVNPDNVNIKQGWLESSNVNIVSEMVQMIELQRMFEAGSKVIQTNDGTLDKAIGIGKYY